MKMAKLVSSTVFLFYTGIVFGTYPDTFPCANSAWTYKPESGKCYLLLSETTKYAFADAGQQCKDALSEYPNVRVRLAELRNENDLQALKEVLVNKSLKEKVYLNANRHSTSRPFTWQSDGAIVQMDFISWTGGIGGGDCLVTFYKSYRFQNKWTTVSIIEETNCQLKLAAICEHDIEPCQEPAEFDSNTMEFIPTKPHVGTTTMISCKSGFYPKNPSISNQAQFKCVGRRDNPDKADPSLYTPGFLPINFPSIECEEISCVLTPETLCQTKKGSINPPNQTQFKYRQNVTMECEAGFVYALDKTQKKAQIQCLTAQGSSSQGLWYPSPSGACIPIRCSESEMTAMVPQHGSLVAARSTLTEEEFGSSQQNMFNQFGNVVTVRCKDAFFYPDHAFEKFIYCGVKANTDIQGEWSGYSGTTLPLPTQCEPVTCQYEDVIAKPHHNVEKFFTIAFENGTLMNVSKLGAMLYNYQTTITYTCKEGYETIRQTQDQVIVCGSIGRWSPQLAVCLKKENNMTISSTGRYLPPLIEAPSAEQIGHVVVAIIVIFFISLLLFDVATLRKDVSWLFNNIRLQKRLWRAKKRLRETKKQAKTD